MGSGLLWSVAVPSQLSPSFPPPWIPVNRDRQLCMWGGGSLLPPLPSRGLDTDSATQPGRRLLHQAHTPRRGLQVRPHPHPRPCTCAIHQGVIGLCRPPALPLCLLHLRHIEVSLPCQGAHEIDLVLLVDLQPWVGTQLPLLVGEHERQNEPYRASDPCVPRWPQKPFTVSSLPGGWLLLTQSPPSSKSLLREAPAQHPVGRAHTPGGSALTTWES